MKKIISFIVLVSIFFNLVPLGIAENETESIGDNVQETSEIEQITEDSDTELPVQDTEEEIDSQEIPLEETFIDEEKQENIPEIQNNLEVEKPLNLDIQIKDSELKKFKEEKLAELSQKASKENTIQTLNSKSVDTNLPYVEGDLIIKYKEGKESKITAKVASIENKGFSIEKETIAKNMAVIIAENKTTQELINEFKNDPDVEYVQPNFIYYIQDVNLPNDADFSKLWGLHNVGQNVNFVAGINDVDIDWPETMEIFSGSTNGTGSIVAVIDSGVNYLHEDLKNKMWNGTNCVNENGVYLGNCKYGYDFAYNDKDPMDFDGHGTHVAGIIGAERGNSLGVVGVNPNTKIMAIRGIGPIGGYTTDLVKSIYFAKNNGAKIINASWGSYWLENQDCVSGTGIVMDMSIYDAIKDFQDVGGLFIAAAGNDTKNHENPSTRHFPAGLGEDFTCGDLSVEGLDNIISVAAVNNKGNVSIFSDYGNNSIHIGAPGEDIYSTYMNTPIKPINYGDVFYNNDLQPTYYEFYSGDIFRYTIDNNTWYFGNGTGKINSTLTSTGFDISNGNVAYLNFSTICLLDDYKDDYLSLSVSGDGINYTEIYRYDKNYTNWVNKSIEIPSSFLTFNFKFKWNWIIGNDNDVGLCVVSPVMTLEYNTFQDNIYKYMDGTSMATPHVAGLASLAYNYRQDLDYKEIKDAILKWGDDLPSLNGKTITGKMINANNTLLALTELEGTLTFSSGAYTNSTGTTLSFSANKSGTYTFSGDIAETLTGNYLAGASLDVELISGDGEKNVSLLLEDDFEKSLIVTGSIILDTINPVINLLSVNSGAYIASESLTLTGNILDVSLGTLNINGTGVTFENNGNFNTTISLTPGINTIQIEAIDLAGNITTENIDVIRIPKAPILQAKTSFGNVEITKKKELIGTGIILYGTGELNNTLTGSHSIEGKISFQAEPETTYYFKGYSTHNEYDGELSDTGSITTPFFIDSTFEETHNLTGSVSVIDATSSGVIFTKTGGILTLKGSNESLFTLQSDDLEIVANNGNWDGVLSAPEKITGSGNFAVSEHSRISNATYKIGSESDGLSFSGNIIEVKLVVDSGYNGKILKVYRSNDNQNTFEYVNDCTVLNGICEFKTSHFSVFTIFEKNAVLQGGGSSNGGGGGGGGGGFITPIAQTTETVYLDPIIRENLRKNLFISKENLQTIKNGEKYQTKIESVIKNMSSTQLVTAYYNLSKLSNHKTVKSNKEFFAYFGDLVAYEIFLRTGEDVANTKVTNSIKTEIQTNSAIVSKSESELTKSIILSKYALQNTANGKEYQLQAYNTIKNMSDQKLLTVYNNLSKLNLNNKEFTNYYRDLVLYEVYLRNNLGK